MDGWRRRLAVPLARGLRRECVGVSPTVLYSLVSTCEARDIDPVEYLKDVLVRVDTHPASRIDELLPHKWSPPLRWTEPS